MMTPPGSLTSSSTVEAEREKFRVALNRIMLPEFQRVNPPAPRIVAFEGPNAAGKTTLCQAIAARFSVPACLGTDSAWSAEPFKTRMIRDADWHASALFFLSGCFEQMRLTRSMHAPLVVMDRSIWSTLAVHAATSIDRLEALVAMLRPIASWVEIPTHTLVLDASFATCQTRIAKKSGAARALDELTANAIFHAREQEFYRWLGRQVSGVLFLNVDSANADQVAESAAVIIAGGQGSAC